jgi:hypothetical protein
MFLRSRACAVQGSTPNAYCHLASIPPGCQQPYQGWQDLLKFHENNHVLSAQEYANKLNALRLSAKVTACTTMVNATFATVQSQLDSQLKAAVAPTVLKYQLMYSNNEDVTDNSPVGQVPFMDCSKRSECPPPQISGSDGMCYTPCGNLVNGIYPNCGLASNAQPIACCSINVSGGTASVCSPYRTSVCSPQEDQAFANPGLFAP